jgi:hypothetical protein
MKLVMLPPFIGSIWAGYSRAILTMSFAIQKPFFCPVDYKSGTIFSMSFTVNAPFFKRTIWIYISRSTYPMKLIILIPTHLAAR